ncbi:hypothetical protein RQP54_17290 [Curvibacter sp. APW13]|uniref:hypothetical protein n=1 Tax=Curvibacter sp. APW13 TaxID=3077236 RepID=UPI0028DE6E17|nr:hypothetical protein [Curvibacter sp. APW13]MDT8992629.1 hypothetical protein [Curvibacter sp. APW13]
MNPKAYIVTNLQQAGSKTFEALTITNNALNEAKKIFSQQVLADLSAPGNDALYQQAKDLAELARALTEVENNLRNVYAMACEVTGVTIKPVEPIAIAGATRTNLRLAKDNGAVLDEKQPKQTKTSLAVWTFLQSHLSNSKPTVITQATIAAGAKIPHGSVGAAIQRLKAIGCISGTATEGYLRLR